MLSMSRKNFCLELIRKARAASLASAILASQALAHHSVTAFFDWETIAEIEGTVTDIFWRNPHVAITLAVTNDEGETEEWELEGGTTNTLIRRGFTADVLSIGDRVRAAGAASRRGEPAIFVSNLLLPGGEEVIVSDRDVALRWTSSSTNDVALGGVDDAAGSGIFKVWGYRASNQLRSPLILTPAALAAKAAFDPRADDPGLKCIPPGMPNAVLNPYPMEFIDEGDRIIQRIEEWDARRVIYLDADRRGIPEPPSHLGYSVGRWDGSTLVVATSQIDFPFLDGDGTPMSENVSMVERYTLSEDESRLEYEVVVTDPAYLIEPAIWESTWVYRPGVEIRPFECTLRDTVSPVYQ